MFYSLNICARMPPNIIICFGIGHRVAPINIICAIKLTTLLPSKICINNWSKQVAFQYVVQIIIIQLVKT